MSDGIQGVIYLLCFSEPLHHARHYLGFCSSYEGLDSRFEYHAKGQGSRLLAAVAVNGGTFDLVRLWKGTRNDERALKNRKCGPLLCPRCGQGRKPKGLEEIQI